MTNDLLDLLNTYTAPFGVTVSPEQWEKFDAYMDILTLWNGKINLTAITEPSGIVVKHFADSLSAAPYIREYSEKRSGRKGAVRLCDVGTGAGFPGIPLKIVFPETELVLVDSLEKRINFLWAVSEELGLSGVDLLHARAEDAGRLAGFRDSFDVVAARAVAPMNVLLEYCAPFVKPGGIFVSMKGSRAEDGFSKAAAQLSVKLSRCDRFILGENGSAGSDLPGENAATGGQKTSAAENDSFGRTIYVFEKTGPTPKAFPRKAGTPSKNPLK